MLFTIKTWCLSSSIFCLQDKPKFRLHLIRISKYWYGIFHKFINYSLRFCSQI